MAEVAKSAPAKPQPSRSDLLGEQKSELVTYIPKDGDPAKVQWGGRTFHANKGVTISNPVLIEKARANKWFHVGEGAPVVVIEETPEPKNQDQYRAHVAAWSKTVTTLAELEAKWASEEPLRMACGIGSSDLDLLGDFLRPIRAELKRRGLPPA